MKQLKEKVQLASHFIYVYCALVCIIFVHIFDQGALRLIKFGSRSTIFVHIVLWQSFFFDRCLFAWKHSGRPAYRSYRIKVWSWRSSKSSNQSKGAPARSRCNTANASVQAEAHRRQLRQEGIEAACLLFILKVIHRSWPRIYLRNPHTRYSLVNFRLKYCHLFDRTLSANDHTTHILPWALLNRLI